jgi:AcrR family transcriptional regulator
VKTPLLRRDLSAQATRAEIIAVARAAFTAKGYAAVKLEDVARSAHATTGAIYHHFGGKAGLLLAVGEHVEQEVVAAIGALVPPGASPWEAIDAAARATLDLCSRPEVARIIFKEAPNVLGTAAWREVEMRYGLGGLQALFQRASDAGQLVPDNPALVTRLVMAGLIEAVESIVDSGGESAQAEAAHAAISRLLGAFRL